MYVAHQTYDNSSGKTHDYYNREIFRNFYNKGENTIDVLQAILWRKKLQCLQKCYRIPYTKDGQGHYKI